MRSFHHSWTPNSPFVSDCTQRHQVCFDPAVYNSKIVTSTYFALSTSLQQHMAALVCLNERVLSYHGGHCVHSILWRRERRKDKWGGGWSCVSKFVWDVRKDGVKEVRTKTTRSVCLCPPPRVADDVNFLFLLPCCVSSVCPPWVCVWHSERQAALNILAVCHHLQQFSHSPHRPIETVCLFPWLSIVLVM